MLSPFWKSLFNIFSTRMTRRNAKTCLDNCPMICPWFSYDSPIIFLSRRHPCRILILLILLVSLLIVLMPWEIILKAHAKKIGPQKRQILVENPGINLDLGSGGSGEGGHFYCNFLNVESPKSSIELFCFRLDYLL